MNLITKNDEEAVVINLDNIEAIWVGEEECNDDPCIYFKGAGDDHSFTHTWRYPSMHAARKALDKIQQLMGARVISLA